MEISPFKIKKFVLDTSRLRVRTRAVDAPARRDEFPAYLVVSTAPNNIDEEMPSPPANSVDQTKQGLAAIAQELHCIQTDPTIDAAPELVVAVHGYNTEEKGIRAWYSDIYRYIAQDDKQIRHRRNLVFVGYRWSSEKVSANPRHLWRSLRALPDVPQAMLAIALVFMLTYWGWSLLFEPLWRNGWTDVLGVTLLSAAVAMSMMIVTLLILRVTVYFRDVYRAVNFGVPDLTELVRQIDQAVIELRLEEMRSHHPSYQENSYSTRQVAMGEADDSNGNRIPKIKLSFLGHSMGGLVITNVVRILSDVFDRRSIEQNPVPDIGNTLSLGRLILVSPDIPILSIISSRSNGLASSLRRFEETYLFSNEGDLALRLASTAANYISFPSARQNHGHRLGSVALANSPHDKGIINLGALRKEYPKHLSLQEAIAADELDILDSLYITHSSGKGDGYLSLGELFKLESSKTVNASLADLFTFFDCTDYKDYKLTIDENSRRLSTKKKVGLLTRAKGRKSLNLWDYTELLFLCLQGQLDVHGGYFHGQYSRQLIYRLAFVGFEDMLLAVSDESNKRENNQEITIDNIAEDSIVEETVEVSPNQREQKLTLFDQLCMEKGIQIYLSPLRYRVDVQGAEMSEAKKEMMQSLQPKPMVEEVEEQIATDSANNSATGSAEQPASLVS